MSVEIYGWAIQKSLFKTYSKKLNQDSPFSHTRENSKMFNKTSKYFSFSNNKPPASWVAHIKRNFLTCHSCSYYSSMFGSSVKLEPGYFYGVKLSCYRVAQNNCSEKWMSFLVDVLSPTSFCWDKFFQFNSKSAKSAKFNSHKIR